MYLYLCMRVQHVHVCIIIIVFLPMLIFGIIIQKGLVDNNMVVCNIYEEKEEVAEWRACFTIPITQNVA